MTTERDPITQQSASQILEGIGVSIGGEYKIGGTTFIFDKIPGSEGMRVFHLIRPVLKNLSLELSGESPNITAMLVSLISDIPEPTFNQITQILFRHVRYSNEHAKYQVLLDCEDEACGDAFQILEVWTRALLFNFLPSFFDLLSRLGLLTDQDQT